MLEVAVRGVSRSLGQGPEKAERQTQERDRSGKARAGRPMVFESGAHVGVRRESARKSGPRPQLYAGDSDDEQKGRRPLC